MKKKIQATVNASKRSESNQIIINPPEKQPPRTFNEAIKRVQEAARDKESKISTTLFVKAQRAEMPYEVVREVFNRGVRSYPTTHQLTKEQYAINRVNSFLSGGASLQEDHDLIPIEERKGMKGTGGAMRPHIIREKSPYNKKIVYHVVDSKGHIKHSSYDELAAKKHLAQKYNDYMVNEAKKLKGKDPCWANYKMVGLKPNGDPNCVGPVKEGIMIDTMDKKISASGRVVPAHKVYLGPQKTLPKKIKHSNIAAPGPDLGPSVKGSMSVTGGYEVQGDSFIREGTKNPDSRFEGTTSLVNTYKKDTPGEYRKTPDPRKMGVFQLQPDGKFKMLSNVDLLKQRLQKKYATKMKKVEKK